MARVGIALLLACGMGCSAPLLPGFARRSQPAAVPSVLGKSRVLWAQGSVVAGEHDIASQAGRDRVWLVFESELDPSTVHASHFALVLDDGRRVGPMSAHFGGADEVGELRSLVLEGEFRGQGGEWRVEQVQIYGRLFAADGRSLKGVDAKVRPPGTAVPVSAQWLGPRVEGEPEACPNWTLRTWWSDDVRGEQTRALAGLRWTSDELGAQSPTGVFDLEAPSGERALPADNVVDLCFAQQGPGRLMVDAGALVGGSGKEVAEAQLPLRVDDALPAPAPESGVGPAAEPVSGKADPP